MAVRILLADDHTLFRVGLRRIIEDHGDFEVVAEASTGLEAVELGRQFQPDVALLDVGMKEMNGIAATAQLLRHSPHTAVMILSMHSDERYVIRSLKAGARGYMLKDAVEEGLYLAINCLARGEHYFSPQLLVPSARELKAREVEDRYELLTDRERQIYHLLVDGRGNKEIAVRLNLSLHTVETHRTRIMEKMDAHGIAELVIGAVRRGDVLPG